jgi:hypothetical protein
MVHFFATWRKRTLFLILYTDLPIESAYDKRLLEIVPHKNLNQILVIISIFERDILNT